MKEDWKVEELYDDAGIPPLPPNQTIGGGDLKEDINAFRKWLRDRFYWLRWFNWQ